MIQSILIRNYKQFNGQNVANFAEYKDSKSFLAVLTLMIECILYPGAHLFSTSGGKEQAASILKEKVNEICELVPAFRREINFGRGATQEGKDYCKYVFYDKSYLDNVAARESSRGRRRHGKFFYDVGQSWINDIK